MAKRWNVLRSGVLGAVCGLCYSAFINFSLLPYAFESYDMTAYILTGLITSIGAGIGIFASVENLKSEQFEKMLATNLTVAALGVSDPRTWRRWAGWFPRSLVRSSP